MKALKIDDLAKELAANLDYWVAEMRTPWGVAWVNYSCAKWPNPLQPPPDGCCDAFKAGYEAGKEARDAQAVP